MDSDGPQVRVKFVTKNAAIRVTETPFAVPVILNRAGLSQVVNHLLNTETPRPFDFHIDGVFLRTTLEKYMQRHALSEESMLTLEYVEALPEPQQKNETNHPDWVSAVSVAANVIVTGCYDGQIRVYNVEGGGLASIKAHQGAVKSVNVECTKQNEYLIASSGKDQMGQLWRFNAVTNQLLAVAALTGHLNSVDTIHLNAKTQQVATGSWDNTVRIWTFPSASDAIEEKDTQPKKKQKNNGSSTVRIHQVEAEIVLTGHTSYVTSVLFHPTQPEIVVSAASDRTVRFWDLTTHLCKQSMAGNRAITDLSVQASTSTGMVLTSHPDHCIRLWDPRATQSGENLIQQTFQSHKEWVNAVEWHPTNDHWFLSCGYDGMVKIWDTRSTIPLHSVTAHSGKAFDVTWRQVEEPSVSFVSGGEDKQLKVFSV